MNVKGVWNEKVTKRFLVYITSLFDVRVERYLLLERYYTFLNYLYDRFTFRFLELCRRYILHRT